MKCNKCTSPLIPADAADIGETAAYGLHNASFTTGYFSKALPDGMRYTFSLCEACLAELFTTFKIPVEEIDFEDLWIKSRG